MSEKSTVGLLIEQVRAKQRALRAHPETYLDGWNECPAMPSIDDFNRAYLHAELIAGGEMSFVSDVARKIEGYRGTLSFPLPTGEAFGIVFFKRHGSFFFVFEQDPERRVRLFYMGLESRVADYCSQIAANFDFDFEDAYFDLRDARIGRFGIPATPEGGS